jgi:predicted RNase H-like nuclease
VEAYAPTSFPTFWERFAGEIDRGSIIAPEEVRQEVTHPDALRVWLRNQKAMFRELSEEMQPNLRTALRWQRERLQTQSLNYRPKDLKADPFVVAIAMSLGAVVVTEERRNGSSGRPSIPDYCDRFGLEVLNLLEFIDRMRWQF